MLVYVQVREAFWGTSPTVRAAKPYSPCLTRPPLSLCLRPRTLPNQSDTQIHSPLPDQESIADFALLKPNHNYCAAVKDHRSHSTMASTEAEVATKAPESDAQEQAPTTTTDAPAAAPAATATPAATEEPPKMGENCHTDRPTRSSTIYFPLSFPSKAGS